MTRVIRVREKSGHRSSAGFTLMEVIVALAVVGVAASIGVSMFGQSYSAGAEVRDRRAGHRFAEEILADMQRDPASFAWPAATGELQPVTKKDPAAITPRPAIRATYPAANTIVDAQYERYTWRGYVRQPADLKTCEITVVVSWTRGGRLRSVTLTALAPASVLEAK